MDYSKLSTDELAARQEELTAQRLALREEARAVADVLRQKRAIEHAAYFGLTPHEYEETKRIAAATGQEFNSLLGKARKKRAVQVAKTTPVTLGVRGKDASGSR